MIAEKPSYPILREEGFLVYLYCPGAQRSV